MNDPQPVEKRDFLSELKLELPLPGWTLQGVRWCHGFRNLGATAAENVLSRNAISIR